MLLTGGKGIVGSLPRYRPVHRLLPKVCRASMTEGTAVEEGLYPHGCYSLSPEGNRMSDILQRLSGPLPTLGPLPGQASQYVKPGRITYRLDGKARAWDYVESLPSVACVLHHTDKDAALLVRQFRPAVYMALAQEAARRGEPAPPVSAAFTYELCAGLVDKRKTLEQIVQEEILEECGYEVPLESIQPLSSYNAAIGITGAKQSMFISTVCEASKVSSGGGGLQHDGEAIEVLALPLSNVEPFLLDTSLPKSAGMMFGLLWLVRQLQR